MDHSYEEIRAAALDVLAQRGKRASVGVNTKLCDKPSGCVVWVHFAADMRPIGPFYWLGGLPGIPLPELGDKRGRQTRADATGLKALRESIREVPRSRFDPVHTIPELTTRLFNVAAPLA